MSKDAKSNGSSMEPTNPVKAVKDQTLKSRFLQSFGPDEDLFQSSLDYQKYWQDKLFYIDEKTLKQEIEKGVLETRHVHELLNSSVYPDMILEEVATLKHDLHLDTSVEFDIGSSTHTLSIPEIVNFDSINRSGLALRTGGIVTSVSWSFDSRDGSNYLAVLVLSREGGMVGHEVEEELSLFRSFHSIENSTIHSSIQIWKFSPDRNQASLQSILDTSGLGISFNLKWAPLISDEVVGILCGTYSDGSLHFFKIKDHGSAYKEYKVVSSSVSYNIQTYRSSHQNVPITTFEFVLHEKVLAGFIDGTIAEFILPSFIADSLEPDEGNIHIPSFVHNIADSPISFISVGTLPSKDVVVHVNTLGNQKFAWDYNSLHSRADSFESVLQPQFHASLATFVCAESYDTVATAFLRHPQERPTLALKVDGVATSLGVSKVFNHPLMLASNSFGELFIVNIARKILSASKVSNKSLLPLRLWKLFYKGENHIAFGSDYAPVLPDRLTKVGASPTEVNVSSVAWNESLSASSVYAAGTHSGLVIIERLDPSYVK